MKRSKFTETQIVNILKRAEKGVKVTDICQKHGIFYNVGFESNFSKHNTTNDYIQRDINVGIGIGIASHPIYMR